MVISTQELMAKYRGYSVPKMKIKREVDSGKYILIKKGLYETDPNTAGHLLAQYIKSPSYLSFEYALAFYGLIPEFVYEYTCATVGQRHTFEYTNHFGRYSYRDVPQEVFFLGTIWIEHNGYSYLMATKEKAICDFLYTIKPVFSRRQLFNFLFGSMRIDIDDFMKLDFDAMTELSKRYKSSSVHKYFIYLLEDLKNGKYINQTNQRL